MQTVTMQDGWASQPDSEPIVEVQSPREPGRLAGSIRMADDFSAIDEHIADLFEEGA